MSDILGASDRTVHESYSFACMRCGYGWEQAYEIKHHPDRRGRTVVVYYSEGRPVASPLTRPSCSNCGSRQVRILQAGTVARVPVAWAQSLPARGRRRPGKESREARPTSRRAPEDVLGGASVAHRYEPEADEPEEETGAERHHWYLPHLHLPRIFHRNPGPPR